MTLAGTDQIASAAADANQRLTAAAIDHCQCRNFDVIVYGADHS